jgi:hypothetical protein
LKTKDRSLFKGANYLLDSDRNKEEGPLVCHSCDFLDERNHQTSVHSLVHPRVLHTSPQTPGAQHSSAAVYLRPWARHECNISGILSVLVLILGRLRCPAVARQRLNYPSQICKGYGQVISVPKKPGISLQLLVFDFLSSSSLFSNNRR